MSVESSNVWVFLGLPDMYMSRPTQVATPVSLMLAPPSPPRDESDGEPRAPGLVGGLACAIGMPNVVMIMVNTEITPMIMTL